MRGDWLALGAMGALFFAGASRRGARSVRRSTLPPGTVLYHGTTWEPEEEPEPWWEAGGPRSGLFVSTSEDVAVAFAENRASLGTGDPVLILFGVTRPLDLLDVGEAEGDLAEFLRSIGGWTLGPSATMGGIPFPQRLHESTDAGALRWRGYFGGRERGFGEGDEILILDVGALEMLDWWPL